jgi:dipeptidase E
MTVLLGGGGSAEDERPVLDRLLELVEDRPGTIAYWPFALDRNDYAEATAFVENALGRSVNTWTGLDGRRPQHLDDHAGVFIGGGNTYHLLNEIRRWGFVRPLQGLAFHGVLYGGSAGAIICGVDIGSAAYFDENDVGLADTAGLDLLFGHSVWCHFVPDHLDDVRRWVRSSGAPAVALSERAGAEVSETEILSIGREPLLVVGPRGDIAELAPGQSRSRTG